MRSTLASLFVLCLFFVSFADERPPLTNIAEAVTMRLGANERRAFDFTGQILVINTYQGFSRFIIRGSDGATSVHVPKDVPQDCAEGDIVRVTGTMTVQRIRLSHTFVADTVRKIGHAPPPAPIDVPADEIAGGKHHFRFVRIRGVLSLVEHTSFHLNWNWLSIRTPNGSAGVTVRAGAYPIEKMRQLIDAEVSVVGIVVYSWGTPAILGAHLSVRGTDAITVLKPAPRDPFAVPELASVNEPHRQRISGDVIAVGERRFFLDCGKSGLVQILPRSEIRAPEVGERVTVTGFAELDPLNLRIADAVFRTEPSYGFPTVRTPEEVTPETLFRHGQSGKLVRIRATVLGRSGDVGSLVLENDRHTLSVDISQALAGSRERPGPGCVVDITGICSVEFENVAASEPFPHIRRIDITPRSASDIVILSRPPWWTAGRLFALVVVLVAVIVAISIWNRALTTLSERRGRDLYRETLARARAEWKVEERTRLSVELHDSISQTLTGVALQVDAAKGSGVDGDSPAARFLETARAMLASCRQELRCCIWDLRSRTFEEKDMTEAVRRTLAPHVGDADVQVRFNVPREILSDASAHDVLRIVRELAVNAIRHGRAAHIRIAGEYRDGTVRFSVRDDGCGFDPAAVPGPRQGHFGLQGIRERIGKRNGVVKAESAPGRGTKVTVSFDADEREDNGQT